MTKHAMLTRNAWFLNPSCDTAVLCVYQGSVNERHNILPVLTKNINTCTCNIFVCFLFTYCGYRYQILDYRIDNTYLKVYQQEFTQRQRNSTDTQ